MLSPRILLRHAITSWFLSVISFAGADLRAQNGITHHAAGTIGDITRSPSNDAGRGGAPPNALCSDAVIQTLNLFGTIARDGDNTGALVDNYFQLPVVWEGFTTTTCMTVRVSYCGTTPRFQGALLALQVGCPITNIVQTPVSAVTNYLCADNNFTITFTDLPAGTYYYPVLQANNSTGPYHLTFFGLPCFGFPPANDHCSGATQLVPGVDCVETSGSTNNTTIGTPASLGCNNGDPSDDVWYSFVATHADHTVTVDPREGFDAVIEVYSGACGSGTLLACRDVALAGEAEVATLSGLTIGETYYVRVYDWYAGASVTNNFTICVQRPPCLADAGTLTAVTTPVCLVGGVATLAATANGDAVVPAGFGTIYLLSQGPGLVIQDSSAASSFDVNATGSYTIHSLVYDPLTLDLGAIQFGVTTCSELNALLEPGGGTICAALDVAGAPITVEACIVCDADAGTITADADTLCFVAGAATVAATPNGDAVVPAGFETTYLLSKGAALVIQEIALASSFGVTTVGDYAVHTLVYDPLTFDPATIQLGVTTVMEVDAQFAQGGGVVCASLDTFGAPVRVEVCLDCDAIAGTLTAGSPAICLVNDLATVTATSNGDAVVPTGFEVVFLLTEGAGQVIQATAASASFDVVVEGSYTIHTLVYDPLTLDIGTIQPGVTSINDVNLQLIQGGGTICAGLDLAGASTAVEVCITCTASAGTLTADTTAVCALNGVATMSATPNGDATVPAGYDTLFILTDVPGAVVQMTGASPSFQVTGIWSYTIHTLVYDPLTFDPGNIEPGVTTISDLNALLIQGGGVICGSLDLVGAMVEVLDCAPANDLCPNAIVLPVNSDGGCPAGGTAGDNTYATFAGDPPACDNSNAGFADVWYTFNSGASTTVTIAFDHGSMTDWGLVVTDACAGTELLCIVQPGDLVEVVTQQNTDHWVRIYSNLQFGSGGSFALCVTGYTQICDGGIVSTAAGGTNPVTVCQDAQADVIDLITSSTSTENYTFVLTDENDNIVAVLAGGSLDFNSAPLGIYHVWGVSYNGILVGADTGGSISGIASTGGCIDVSDAFLTVVVEICEGIRELDGATWNAYPNPGNGDLTLFNGSIEGLVRLDLLDLTGRSIHQEQWRNVRGQPQRISLAGHVAQGTYVLRIISASGRSEQRIVVR